MKSEGSGIFGSCNRTREYKNGERKGEESTRLANTKVCQGYIQKFLRLANYYYQFMQDFAFIAKLLYNLVKKEQKWDWTEK